MTNLEWLKGVITMTNLEWLKNLSTEELKKELSTVYKQEWLNAEHTPKVKPCPVCKGKMSIESNHGCYLVCPDCGLHFGIDAEAAEQGIIEGGYSTRETLVDAWNLILDTEG